MASIKQRPGSPYWICCYRKANGERTQRSTKQENKDKAWGVCLACAEAERKALQGSLTEAQARLVISEIIERTTGEPMNHYSAEGWLREWLAGKKQTKSDGTSVRYAQVIENFISHLGKRAKLNNAQVSSRDLKAFRDKEINSGKAPKTCNLAVKVVGGAFNAARRQGLITVNPAESLESLQHRSESKETFNSEQDSKLLEVASSDDWQGAMLLAYFTGARLRDVTNMTWDAIDLTRNLITFRPQKTARTGKVIVIPLHPQLQEHFMTIAGQDNPRAQLFPTLAGRETGGAYGLSRTFASIMKKANKKAEEARPRKGVGRAASKLSFQGSVRHLDARLGESLFSTLTPSADIDWNLATQIDSPTKQQLRRVAHCCSLSRCTRHAQNSN